LTSISVLISIGLVIGLLGLVLFAGTKGSASSRNAEDAPDTADSETSLEARTAARVAAELRWYNRPFYRVLIGIIAFVLLYPLYDQTFNQGKSTAQRQAERIGMDVKEHSKLLDEIGYTGWLFNQPLKQGCTPETRFCALIVDGKAWHGRRIDAREDGTEMMTCLKPGMNEDKVSHPLLARVVYGDGRVSEPVHWKSIKESDRGYEIQFTAPKVGVMRSKISAMLDSKSDDTRNSKIVVYTIRAPRKLLEEFVAANYAARPDDHPTLCSNRHIRAVWSKTFM
jgi:hypothetical protein